MKVAIPNITLVIGLVALAFGTFMSTGCSSCPKGTQLQSDGMCYAPAPASTDGGRSDVTREEAAGSRAQTNAATKNVTDDPSGENEGEAADDSASSKDAKGSRTQTCEGHAGKIVCDEKGKMLMCDDAGAAKSLATCKSKELCQAGLGAGKCAVCSLGDAQCEGSMLMRCSPDGSAFVPESDCMSAVLCDAVEGSCKPSACKADTYVCEGDRLSVCKPDLTGYQFSKQCPAGLCDAESKDCKQCNPGSMSCNGSTIMSCDAQGKRLAAAETCAGETPVCDPQRGCVECKAKADCKVVHDCADLTDCSAGECKYAAKMRRTALGDGTLVREGNPDPDPIYVVFGGALFYVSTEEEVNGYGGFANVQIKPLTYTRCPVPGTLITERGDPAGHIYTSDGKKLSWVKSPTDLEMYCGGSASVLVVPAGSLTTTTYPPPAGLCPVNDD